MRHPSRIRLVQAYSDELGKVLDQNTANKVTKVIASTLEQRGSVEDVIQALKDEPDFDRARARRVAITETLTATSIGDDEITRCHRRRVVTQRRTQEQAASVARRIERYAERAA